MPGHHGYSMMHHIILVHALPIFHNRSTALPAIMCCYYVYPYAVLILQTYQREYLDSLMSKRGVQGEEK